MSETTKYRLGGRDTDGVIFWYDQDSHEDAYRAWKLLDAYAREGVTFTVQQRFDGEEWETVIGDSFLLKTAGPKD